MELMMMNDGDDNNAKLAYERMYISANLFPQFNSFKYTSKWWVILSAVRAKISSR